MVLDVGPLDADRVDLHRQERRPLERVAGGRADGEEDAEAVLVSKVPSPRKSKLRASPASSTEPMGRCAPTDVEGDQLGVVPAAPVSRVKSRAVSVT